VNTDNNGNSPNEPTGEDLKDAALRRHHLRRPALIRAAQRSLLTEALARGPVTIDDARGGVEVPEGFNPKAFGAVPGTLARCGILRSIGFVKSLRFEAHARRVTLWELADRDAAMAWLATHPELPEEPSTN